jgi:predicted pyridoxine 5'-phosphate oxidase superfamily flavin-nucleotide-binding protein
MLTPDMQRIIAEQRLGFVATAARDGTPNVSPKGTFTVLDEETIAFGEIRSPGTIRNLRANPRVEVNFVDPFVRKGYRFAGTTEVVERGDDRFAALLARFQSPLAPRMRAIVTINVTKALPLTSPAYDDGTPEHRLGRDLVVEHARRVVELLGHPEGAGAAARVSLAVGRLDQCAARPPLAPRGIDEQVLEVAVPRWRPGRAMEQDVGQADGRVRVIDGDEGDMEIGSARHEPLPRCFDHVVGEGRLVKGDVASEKAKPCGPVVCLQAPHTHCHRLPPDAT